MSEMTTAPLNLGDRMTWILGAVALLVLLAYHSSLYYPFIADDALISLRYAERFLQGEGLTWTAGEYVEGYSNLAWILGISALGVIGIDLIDATRVLGVLSILMASVALLPRRKDPSDRRFLPWFGASLLLFSAPPVAVWVIGGLEQTLFVAALLWFYRGGLYALDTSPSSTDTIDRRTLLTSGVAGGILCLTRPDGPLFIAIFTAVYLTQLMTNKRGDASLSRIQQLKIISPLIVIPFLFALSQLIFRIFYYGDFLPNTAYVKASHSAETWAWGQAYALSALPVIAPHVFPAISALRTSKQASIALLWLSVMAWSIYVIAIGGDIFPGHRHAVVVCALLAMMSSRGIAGFSSLLSRLSLVTLVIVCAWLSFSASQRSPSKDTKEGDDINRYTIAKLERWEWDGQVIGEWLGKSMKNQDPLLAVTAAGTLPYFSGLRAIDLQGLNDRHIAHQAPRPNYPLAHNHGDGDYVLSRKPDLIAFRGVGLGEPIFVSGDEMKTSKEFIVRYRQRTFEGQYPYYVKSKLYLRLDGLVGVQSSNATPQKNEQASRPSEVYIPAYLFRQSIGLPSPARSKKDQRNTTQSGEPKQSTPASEIVAKWPLEEIVYLNNFPLAAGQWSVELDPPYPFRIQNMTQPGPQSAHLGIQVLSSAEAILGPPPKTYQKGQEIIIRGVKLTKVGASTQASFIASTRTIEEASLLEAAAIGRSSMRTLEDFEGSKKREGEQPIAEWAGRWEGSTTLSKYIGHGGVRWQNPVRGYTGERLFNSFMDRSGDQATMKFWSPSVKLPPHSVLSFKVGGGKLGRGGGLRVWIDGIAIGTWAGKDNEGLEQYHIDLRLYEGSLLQLELIDQGQGSWGHLLVDDIWLSDHILLAKERSILEAKIQPQRRP